MSFEGADIYSELNSLLSSKKEELAQNLKVHPDQIKPLDIFIDYSYFPTAVETCAKKGCKRSINKPLDSKFCIFHAQADQKGVAKEVFNQLIFDQIIKEKNCNFEGYIFPYEIKFPNHIIFKDVNFNKTKFLNNVYFLGVHFLGNSNFKSSKFNSKTFFMGSKFFAGINFDSSNFLESVIFVGTQFYSHLKLKNVIFQNGVYFDDTKFFGETHFINTKFYNNVFFDEVQFSNFVTFQKSQFSGKIKFTSNLIKHSIKFDSISFINGAIFQFQKPRFQPVDKIIISFINISFNPFNTHFENIGDINNLKKHKFDDLATFIIFRNCELSYVLFSKNNMSLFSFYNSTFDKVKLSANRWLKVKDSIFLIPFYRNYVTLEELILEHHFESKEQKKNMYNLFSFEELLNYQKIVKLYQQLKNAYMNNSKHKAACWSFYNKFEMKRLEFSKNFSSSNSYKKIIGSFNIVFLYLCKILFVFWVLLNGTGLRSQFKKNINEIIQ
jgi:hypothetical protein